MPNIHCKMMQSKLNNNSETVLFLHGWGGSTNSFLFAQKSASSAYQTLSVDFNGFGNSPMPQKPMDTYLYALSIYELLLKHNIHTISIVAHSFGGRIAILLASIFHIQVKKLIIVSSAGLKPRRSVGYYAKVKCYKFCKWLVKLGWLKQSVLNRFGSSDYKQLNSVMRASFIQIVNQNLQQFLKYIQTPTLIVWGKNDKTTPVYMAKRFKKHILNSELVLLKHCGHFSYLEKTQTFVQLMLWFLEQ